jgi:perosamine synthetase
MELTELLINESEIIINAWKKINNNGKGVVFVINNNNKLVGILSDGDIRQYFFSHKTLGNEIKKAMNIDFKWAAVNDSRYSILQKMDNEISLIPLVNDRFEVVDFFQHKMGTHIPIAIPNLSGKEFKYLLDAFLSTWISSKGKYILDFEEMFSNYCTVEYGVATSNGTAALHLALLALDINVGDEVIVPDLTFAATINAVLYCGATPVIVDIEEDSWCMDSDEVKKAITAKTKAIIPVHLYGQPCNMDKIMEIAKNHHLFVIEDCAEAHGSEYRGRKVGSFGDIGCFSFFANKIITTGEGGMCITNNSELAIKMKQLRDHGMSETKRYWHDCVGYNYRMTNLQAAIGLAQLERIKTILNERKELEILYKEILKDVPDIEFQRSDIPYRKKITWMISILYHGNKNVFIEKLTKNNIETRPFFYPLSQMPVYKDYIFSGTVSHKISRLGMNLPTNKIVNIELINTIKGCL